MPDTNVEGFDSEEFKEILITVHEEFKGELDLFFENIKKDITTYYDDELSAEIISRIDVMQS